MADLGMNFDATEVDPSTGGGGGSPLDPGRYVAEIVEADVKPNSKGTGTILKFTAQIIEPAEFAERKFFGNINLTNASAVAQKIGREELSALCHATGQMAVSDTDDLLYKAFRVDLDVEAYRKSGAVEDSFRNVIKRYVFGDDEPSPPETKAPPARPTPSTARSTGNGGSAPSRPATSAAPATRTMPWKRSA